MRIVHICQSADPRIGGSLTVARALVHGQREHGEDAWLLFLYSSPKTARIPDIRDYEILCGVNRSLRWSLGLLALHHYLMDLKPDVIHHHDGILWPRVVTARLDQPRVTHGHLAAPTYSRISGRFWTHKYIAQNTDCLIAISSWVADSWVRSGFPRQNVRLVPNGVDCSRFHIYGTEQKTSLRSELGLPAQIMILLWIGRMDRYTKGLDRVVSLARILKSSCKLLIVGDGPDRKWLERQLANLPPDFAPILTGTVADPSKYFGAADALLFTSRSETFGLVLLEAAACGLPVFAFECEGGGRELLEQLRAVIAPREDAEWLRDRILTNKNEPLNTLANRIQSRFSWNATARQVLQVYRELLQ